MATITEVKNVCDICQAPRRKVRSYRVGTEGVTVEVELCREHRECVDLLIARGHHVPTPSKRVKVWDVEEIEKRKREQKRIAPNL